jgi:hypothetical protein
MPEALEEVDNWLLHTESSHYESIPLSGAPESLEKLVKSMTPYAQLEKH